jgi:membrane protein required for beta-lactamase induction
MERKVHIKRPSAGALALALVPFLGMCFSVTLWDRVDPMILGLPFNLFWLLAWIVLTSVCMWGAYRIETAGAGAPERRRDRHPR